MKKILKSIICISLVAVMLMMGACNNGTPEETDSGSTEPVSVIVLTKDLAKGSVIAAKDVEVKELPANTIPENYIQKRTDAVGRSVTADLKAGDCLHEGVLSKKAGEEIVLSKKEIEDFKAQLRKQFKDELLDDLRGELKSEIESGEINASDLGYIVLTDYVEADTHKDVSAEIQKVIDANPGRTIFIPDGEYILANPIVTSADPAKSVSFRLSNYATLKAAATWAHKEAMVRLGAKDTSDANINLSFEGGIIDGNMVATALSVESGRQAAVRNVSIKHTAKGIHIMENAVGTDIDLVHVVGNNKTGSIGVHIEGAESTVTDMRIAAIETGVLVESEGNFMRNLHPLFIFGGEYGGANDIDYSKSVAFWDKSGGINFYDYCYSDQLSTGFRFNGGATPVLQSCLVMWYAPNGDKEVGFQCDGKFDATILNARVMFRDDLTTNGIMAFLKVTQTGGKGIIENPHFSYQGEGDKDNSYMDYLVGKHVS